ncbi:hypothetical protein [Rhodopila sp.]|uniref:hypothetical protein n=1 Tax=Rhodopila sp. TaxID=2480087 RepID=UPI003D0BD3F1
MALSLYEARQAYRVAHDRFDRLYRAAVYEAADRQEIYGTESNVLRNVWREVRDACLPRLQAGYWLASGRRSDCKYHSIERDEWSHIGNHTIEDWLAGHLKLAGQEYHVIHVRPASLLPFCVAAIVFGNWILVRAHLLHQRGGNKIAAESVAQQLNSDLLKAILNGHVEASGFDQSCANRRLITVQDLHKQWLGISGSDFTFDNGTSIQDVRVRLRDPFTPVMLVSPIPVHVVNASDIKPDQSNGDSFQGSKRKSGPKPVYNWRKLVTELLRRAHKGNFSSIGELNRGDLKTWCEVTWGREPGSILNTKISLFVPAEFSQLGIYDQDASNDCVSKPISDRALERIWRELIGLAMAPDGFPESWTDVVRHLTGFCIRSLKFRPSAPHLLEELQRTIPPEIDRSNNIG